MRRAGQQCHAPYPEVLYRILPSQVYRPDGNSLRHSKAVVCQRRLRLSLQVGRDGHIVPLDAAGNAAMSGNTGLAIDDLAVLDEIVRQVSV